MLKKYLPFILLLAAACFLYWIKTHQGKTIVHPPPDPKPITINPVQQDEAEPFDRNIPELVFTKHARCRMNCRHIDESEIREILKNGTLNKNKIEEDNRGKTYPLEGYTHDKQHVRIVFAPKKEELVVVTVIDLDTEWSCDCK